MNASSLQLGHISQNIQLSDYNYHLKALEKIKNKPSEYKAYTRPRHFENVIKKNKLLAVTFDKREWNNALDSKNVWLLGNISKIKGGDYKTFVTKNQDALSYKLKSLRKESTNKEHHRIAIENNKMQDRLGYSCSTIKAASLLKSSSECLKHLDHLSKYNISKRQMEKLPSLLEGASTLVESKSTMTLRKKNMSQLREHNAKDGFLLSKAQANNASTFSKKTQKKEEQEKPKFNAQDSIINPDIHQNFYPPGSLLIELKHLNGLNKEEQTVIAEIKSTSMELIETFEYAFDNRDKIDRYLGSDCIKDHEDVSVYIYIKNLSDGEKFLIGNYNANLANEQEEEGDDSYKEKVNEEITYEDIKFSLRVVFV